MSILKRSSAKVKLLSAWFGLKPNWYDKFVTQMQRYELVDWECIPPCFDKYLKSKTYNSQIEWFIEAVSTKVGFRCFKDSATPQNLCDFRPLYGHVFEEYYKDYDWWGWCDLDIVFGNLDELLPLLLTDEYDVINFKPNYLSGCFVLLRNTEQIRMLYRTGQWEKVITDPRYHCWDESGNNILNESFYHLLIKAKLRINQRYDLHSYDSHSQPCSCWFEGSTLMSTREQYQYGPMTTREALFHHFMSDQWPLQ